MPSGRVLSSGGKRLLDFTGKEPQSRYCKSKPDGIPMIVSLSGNSAPIGEIIEIKGCNLSGLEGDLDVYFERSDGKKIMLTDLYSYAKTGGSLMKVKLQEPCQEGEMVMGRYSGIKSLCDFVKLTPGDYKVYVEPFGQRSNVINFTVTGDSDSNPNQDEITNLNQKVADLQNQLDDSKKTQSLLEQRLNSIISWIKSFFPFFK